MMKLIAAVFLLCSQAQALVNGRALDGSPDIVRLRYSKTSVCSGVYIDPFTILTAAHCTQTSETFPNRTIQQVESVNDSVIDVKVISFITHPGYSNQFWPSSDIGLVKTSENRKFEGAFILSETPIAATADAFLYGTGRIESHIDEFHRTIGENRFYRIGSVLAFFGPSRKAEKPKGNPVTIAHGDSGGTITDSATGRIIAVITTSTVDESASVGLPSLCTGTSVVSESNRSFILKNLGRP